MRHTGVIELPTLHDGELLLRPAHPDDADAITAACQDPEIPRWTFVPTPYTRAHAEQFIASTHEEAAAGTTVNLLAFDAADGRLLGSFGLMELGRRPGYGEIGYWVAADARGRGVATRATRLLAGWARRELGLTELEILPHKDNAPSRRVAERAGFQDTGELVGSARGGVEQPIFAVYRWRVF